MQGGKHLEYLEQSALLADADLAAQLVHTLCALLPACLAAQKSANLQGELLVAVLLSTLICWSKCSHHLCSIRRTWQCKRITCARVAVSAGNVVTNRLWTLPNLERLLLLGSQAHLLNLPHLTLQSRSRGCGLSWRAPSLASSCTPAAGRKRPPAARLAPT